MLREHFHEDLGTLHVNCQPPHTYYIPFGAPAEDLQRSATPLTREKSARFFSLDGDWAFIWYPRAEDVPPSAVAEEEPLLLKDNGWSIQPVPSCWQIEEMRHGGHGDAPERVPTLPFPYDPPLIDEDNPAAVYARDFVVDASTEGLLQYLVFEGVSSCFYVYVNGVFAGYSQVSHSISEFEISSLTHTGKNRIAVVVLKYGDGSYLENGQPWRLSGIFRPVYLLFRPKGHLLDYSLQTSLSPDFREATLQLEITAPNPEEALAILSDPSGTVLGRRRPDAAGRTAFTVEFPRLWTAETPDLYTLTWIYGGEFIYERIGLRELKIHDGTLKLNGRPIKLKGVVWREMDPEGGLVVNEEQIRRDLILMKRNNINAIRVCHPCVPAFYQLCDQMGFYVVDTADIATRRLSDDALAMGPESLENASAWSLAFLDRMRRMVEGEKNRACVLFWSSGAVAGYGDNVQRCAEWAHERDPNRPFLCDGAFPPYMAGKLADAAPELSMIALSYPEPAQCAAYFDAQRFGTDYGMRPMLLTEYAKADGNGCGGLADYWRLIYKYQGLIGGFVSEWADMCLVSGTDSAGQPRYVYGGAVSSAGGLIAPDGQTRSSLRELKYVLQPVDILPVDLTTGTFCIVNLYDFIYLSRLECVYEVTRFGKVTASGSAGVLPIAPGRSQTIRLDYRLPADGRCFVRISFKRQGDDSPAGDGSEAAFAQFELPTPTAPLTPAFTLAGALSVRENDSGLAINGLRFQYTFDKRRGTFSQITLDGEKLLAEPMSFQIWRAPTDNNRKMESAWQAAGYDRMKVRSQSLDAVYVSGESLLLRTELTWCTPALTPLVRMLAEWKIYASGVIEAAIATGLHPRAPYLPRFGVRALLYPVFGAVEYFGLGPRENYIDKHRGVYKGRFVFPVTQMGADYVRPQENGNRYGTEWAAVYNHERMGILFAAEPGFDFSALPYTEEELIAHTASPNQEPAHIAVCADYLQSGVGTGGIGLAENYQLCPMSGGQTTGRTLIPRTFTFRFCLSPVFPDSGSLPEMAARSLTPERGQDSE